MLNEMLALYALSHYTVNDGGVVGLDQRSYSTVGPVNT